MKREIIIMGDIEMGGGTLTDDFISDHTLAKLISTLAQRKHPVDLVLNGDTFDFLKCPYVMGNTRSYPRHITAEISLSKLTQIHKSHEKVFLALKKFVQEKENRLYFIIGNHDHDLFFAAVQQKMREYLGTKRNVHFRLYYRSQGVYAEHGQQYDFLNRIKPNQPFHTYGEKQILNIPWLSFGLISRFMFLKEEHPFLERIKPLPLLFAHHQSIVQKLSWHSLKYFFLSIVYFPVRHYYDPTYNFPREMIRELYRRIKKVHWDVDAIVEKFKRKRRRLIKKNRVLVLGHIHDKYVEERDGTVLIHPSTWRDEYLLDPETKKLRPMPKRYVKVLIEDNDELNWELVEISGRKEEFNFDDVAKDEVKYIRKAAEMEKHHLWF